MVYIDEQFALGDGRGHRAKALEAGGIGSDDAIEFGAAPGFLKKLVGIKELILLRNDIFVPAHDLLSFIPQGQREAELRADAVAVGTDMADDAKRAVATNSFDDAVNDFGVGFHLKGETAIQPR